MQTISKIFVATFILTACVFYAYAVLFIPFGRPFLLTAGILLAFRWLFCAIFAAIASSELYNFIKRT